ncbi:MAG: A24 family peptidase [Methanobrevibacter sp.]|jgi:Flp pilus assembly protein protease CpaA|nr:A24 family peptidase [Candidatus Methanovirga basalitermitum]
MITTFILVIIISIGTLIGAIYDIKNGTIPNKLNFLLIISGIVINIVLSILYKDIKYIEFSMIFGLMTFIFGYYLWKIGFWGGGDVKLITAISIFLPFEPILHKINISYLNTLIPIIAIYPFPITVFLNSIVLSLPFVLFYLTIINLKKTDDKITNLVKARFNQKNLIKLTYIFNIFRLKSLKIIIMSLSTSIAVVYIRTGEIKMINMLKLLLIGLFLFVFSRLLIHTFKYLKSFLLNKTMISLPISNIEEGMIIQNLQIPKEIEKEAKIRLKSLKIRFFENESKISGSHLTSDSKYYSIGKKRNKIQLIANSKHASGIDEYEVEFLKDLVSRELIEENIDVKIAIPYGPSLFMGLITGIILGDICSLIIAILKKIILKSIF